MWGCLFHVASTRSCRQTAVAVFWSLLGSPPYGDVWAVAFGDVDDTVKVTGST